ncbi:MAG: type II toxin-antitoxin system VapC family toxin [Candidatus Bathyarchaeia archaeon]
MVDDEKSTLIKLAQFSFRKETGAIREGLYDGLVEMAIFSWCESDVQISQIPEAIDAIYPIILHKSIIKASVNRLIHEGTLIRRNGEKYVLSPNRKEVLTKLTDTRKEQIELLSTKFQQEVNSILHRVLSPDESLIAKNKLFLFISKYFFPRSKYSALLLCGKKIELSDSLVLEGVLKTSLADVENETLRGALKRGILNLFQTITPEVSEIFFEIVQNLYLLEVLNIDPDCSCIEKAEFSRIKFLLDTNVLVNLLCTHDPRRHKIALDFVEICKNLGTKLYVTDLTLSEYNHLLENSNSIFESINIPSSLLSDYPDPFISSYAEDVQLNPTETWEGYCSRMKKLGGNIEGTYGIKRYKYDWSAVFQKDYFEETKKAVAQSAEQFRGEPKHPEVARHDAAHLILVRELRDTEKATIFGPNLWFATLDHTLTMAEGVLDKYYPDNPLSTMYCDIWIQMVAPFLTSSKGKANAPEIFAHFISSQFWAKGERINYNDLQVIQGDWLNYSQLNERDIKEILSENFVKSYIKIAKGFIAEEKDIPEETKTKFTEQLSVKIEDMMSQKLGKFETELNQQSLQIEELRKENAGLKSSQNEKVEDQTKTIWRHGSGIMAAILLAVNVYMLLIGRIQLSLYSVPYLLGSGIVICILLMIAIAYDKVEVALKMILRLPK